MVYDCVSTFSDDVFTHTHSHSLRHAHACTYICVLSLFLSLSSHANAKHTLIHLADFSSLLPHACRVDTCEYVLVWLVTRCVCFLLFVAMPVSIALSLSYNFYYDVYSELFLSRMHLFHILFLIRHETSIKVAHSNGILIFCLSFCFMSCSSFLLYFVQCLSRTM